MNNGSEATIELISIKELEDAIYVSLLSLSLVKARVKKSVLVGFYGNSYLRNQPDDFIITYSFLRCG